MGKAFLSRHFVGEQGAAVASIPFPPPVSDGSGSFMAHNLLGVGSWNEDAQEHRLSIFDVAVWYSGPEASTPSLNRLASFQHSGAVTATKAADLGNGSVLLATASDEGTICRLRMQVPTHPGSSPESINLKGEDLDEAMLKPCVDAHTTSIAAMDLHQDTKKVLSVAVDGSMALSHIDGTECSTSVLYRSKGSTAFTAVSWATSHACYTGSLQGCVQAWDTRHPNTKPTLTLPSTHPLLNLTVNPAQPHLCAASYSNGDISIWDTRSAARAVHASILGAATGMQFISGDAVSYKQAQLVFCTTKGAVGVMDSATGGLREVYQEPTAGMGSMLATTVGAVNQLFVLSDQEGILFIANAL